MSDLPFINGGDSGLGWMSPCKRIYGNEGVQNFQRSLAIDRIQKTLYLICTKVSLTDVPAGVLDDSIVAFENALYPGVSKQRIQAETPEELDLPGPEAPPFDINTLPEAVKAVLGMLDDIKLLKEQTPPFPGPRRYGNMACRDWHDKLTTQIDGIFANRLGKYNVCDGFRSEAKYYFLGSFGSRERLDYGTGHELSFLAFISLLLMCRILPIETTGQQYLVIFSRYYDFVRSLILSYTLEPAGSHGVWGLDDHFHLIYILGSSQMVEFTSLESGQKSAAALNYRMGLTPSTVFNPTTLKHTRTRNLYYNAIAFIKKVKFGPFNEHSPLLYEISTSKSWEKIAKGMVRMYYGEVLSKFPVVQHFYFGHVLFPWIDKDTNRPLPETSPEDEEPNTEAQSIMPGSTTASKDYRSGAELAMGSLYENREIHLAKLQEERARVSQYGNRQGNELPTSTSAWPTNAPLPPEAKGAPNDEMVATQAPWLKKDIKRR